MNPISTFEPTAGAHVHDALNNVWLTLTAEDVAEMQRELREHGRRDWAIENWDGFVLDGWLPPETTPPSWLILAKWRQWRPSACATSISPAQIAIRRWNSRPRLSAAWAELHPKG